MIDVARLDSLKADADALWRHDFGLPDGYQRYIEYHGARQRFANALATEWPAIRALIGALANDQHLMMNDSERIPHHDRTQHRNHDHREGGQAA